jgi:hypothetical protein
MRLIAGTTIFATATATVAMRASASTWERSSTAQTVEGDGYESRPPAGESVLPTAPAPASSRPSASLRAEVLHDGTMFLGQPLSDERAVAGLGVTLDAEKGRFPEARQPRSDRQQVGVVQDLGGVPPGVLGGELPTGAFADAEAIVLRVLEAAQLSSGSELGAVFVEDAGIREGPLQSACVGPGVFGPADTAALTDVEHQVNARVVQPAEEGLGIETVDADRRDCGA